MDLDGYPISFGLYRYCSARTTGSLLSTLNMLHRHETSSAQMQGRAKTYSKKLKSFKFLKFMHLLLDVIKEVSKASLLFQRDDVTVSD